jgi:hypothetical protein
VVAAVGRTVCTWSRNCCLTRIASFQFVVSRRPARTPPPAKWLGTEERFGNARDRGRLEFNKSGTVFDPVERARRLVRGELKGLADDVREVCYSFAGQ